MLQNKLIVPDNTAHIYNKKSFATHPRTLVRTCHVRQPGVVALEHRPWPLQRHVDLNNARHAARSDNGETRARNVLTVGIFDIACQRPPTPRT